MATIRYAKNLRGIRRDADYTKLATRLIGKGASGDDVFTIARATWPITAINATSLTVTLGENPIAYDRQLDGLGLTIPGTYTFYAITNTLAASQTVHVPTVDGLSVGQRVEVRRRGLCPGDQGADLPWLDHPDRRDEFGVWEAVIVAEDLPRIDNLADDPFFDAWQGTTPDMPVGYSVTGNSSKETDPTRFRYGTASWRFDLQSGPVELQGPWEPVYPTAESPYFSLQIAIMMELGAINLYLDCDTVGDGSFAGDGKVIRIPAAQSGRSATTSAVGIWENLGIAGVNLYDNPGGTDPLCAPGTKRVRLAITKAANTSWAKAWLDAVQLTQTQSTLNGFYGYRASNQLWKRLNDAFTIGNYADPDLSYQIQFQDYFRARPSAYPAEAVQQGDKVTVVDVPLGISAQPIVSDVQRDLTPGGAHTTAADFRTAKRDFTRRTYNRDLDLQPAPAATTPPTNDQTSATPTTTGGMLSHASAVIMVNPDGDGQDYVYVAFFNNTVIEGAPGRFTIDAATTTYGSVITGRDPTLEEGGSNLVPGAGGFRYPVTLTGTATVTDVIIITLKDGGTATQTAPITIDGLFV